LFATTPPVNETARGLAIELLLNNGSRVNTGFTFEYRDNTVFTAIKPKNHLTVYVSFRIIVAIFCYEKVVFSAPYVVSTGEALSSK